MMVKSQALRTKKLSITSSMSEFLYNSNSSCILYVCIYNIDSVPSYLSSATVFFLPVLRFELFKELLFQEFFLSVTPESKLISPNLPEGDSFQTFMEVTPLRIKLTLWSS